MLSSVVSLNIGVVSVELGDNLLLCVCAPLPRNLILPVAMDDTVVVVVLVVVGAGVVVVVVDVVVGIVVNMLVIG